MLADLWNDIIIKTMNRKDCEMVIPSINDLYRCRTFEKKCGILNEQDEVVVPFIYEWIGKFENGLAPIQLGRFYGFINSECKIVVPIVYTDTCRFSDGLASVEVEDKYWGCVDMEGKMIIPAMFDKVDPFYNGLALVEKNRIKMYIDKDLNYYDWDLKPMDCKGCECYNDKLMTELCCMFWREGDND